MNQEDRKRACSKCGTRYWRIDPTGYPWRDQCWTCARESESAAVEIQLQDMIDDECRMPWERKRK